MHIFGNLPIFHFQGALIQNLAVVSVSVSFQGLDIQDLASLQIGLGRSDPTPRPVPSAGFDPGTSTWSPNVLHIILAILNLKRRERERDGQTDSERQRQREIKRDRERHTHTQK